MYSDSSIRHLSTLCRTFSYHESESAFCTNDIFHLVQEFSNTCSPWQPSHAISLLRLAQWDPDVFFDLRQSIVEAVGMKGIKLAEAITTRISRSEFPLYRDSDVAFARGRVWFKARAFDRAKEAFLQSIKSFGDHPDTLFNLMLCAVNIGDLQDAKSLCEVCLEVKPKHKRARQWKRELERRMRENLSLPL